ncbi:double-strand-break repair protein rad21-like protein 1 [Acanthochromis polyacanthus]|uniref:double-strand-break repair protein rad21-like protein 1 n=1 Tax=Acanthochromis polyacanthus TaxID=80966 RepID=UPI002234E1CE|nr:double-strand-break repair protein rad21-like protein 1 [Acanthochromis polyacanthus]
MMFYTQLFTSKRGPLAKIWLAAHWERKLTKAHVFECNLETTIREIISPKMNIGLRTSGHLLLGVVRIYSRKAKYLLADCNDALVKIKVAFRPGQTDLPVDGLEATTKAITLMEDFTAFDSQLPHPSDIDVVDHFSLNQSRSEDITLKEDFGNGFLSIADFVADRRDPMHVNTSSPSETTLLPNEEAAFALEPVPVTPNLEDRRGKRKRKLVVDQTKELSNKHMKEQLSDYSDLLTTLDLAPPTVQLMQWKESGGADKLFAQPCSTVIAPQMKELFAKSVFQVKSYSVSEEAEEMRQEGQEGQKDLSALTIENVSVVDSTTDREITHNTELTVFDPMNDNQLENTSQLPHDASRSEFTHPELPSEDSMFVHPSYVEQDTQSTSLHTQSMLGSQDFEERKITRRAQNLLKALKQSRSSSDSTFSLQELCEGGSRSWAANTFLCFLFLSKQRTLHLHQRAPYEDIFATPGPKF